MGCATSAIASNDSKTKDVAGDDIFAPQEIIITDQHKKVIVKNWKFLSTDLIGRGTRIFSLIFTRNPMVKSLFSCGHLEGDELVNDPRFLGHAQRFMQAVGAVVDNIDNYREALAPLLNDLGRRHVGFKGFKPIYFNDFQESIMQVFAEDLGSKFNSFARESWRLVLLFILTELKRGFTQCLREKGMLNQAIADGQTTVPDSAEITSRNNDVIVVNADVSAPKEDDNANRDVRAASLFAAYKTG